MRTRISGWIGVLLLGFWLPAPDSRGEEEVDQWIHLFESADRQEWQKPDRVVGVLGLRAGQNVADIGAGSGYFSRRFAKQVGPEGSVWAVDIEPAMLRYIQKSAHQENLQNIVTILATPESPMLPAGRTDLIFICDTIHLIPDRVSYLKLLRRNLAQGGRLVIIDFHKEALPVGPPPPMKLTRDDVLADARKAGFQLSKEHTFLPYQYFLEFKLGSSR